MEKWESGENKSSRDESVLFFPAIICYCELSCFEWVTAVNEPRRGSLTRVNGIIRIWFAGSDQRRGDLQGRVVAQRVLPVRGLQRSAGRPALHIAGGDPVLREVLQQPVRQEVRRLQLRHHRWVARVLTSDENRFKRSAKKRKHFNGCQRKWCRVSTWFS